MMLQEASTVKLPFNNPQLKVFPHLKFSFDDPKSKISALNSSTYIFIILVLKSATPQKKI